jgi:hypothetical protein
MYTALIGDQEIKTQTSRFMNFVTTVFNFAKYGLSIYAVLKNLYNCMSIIWLAFGRFTTTTSSSSSCCCCCGITIVV